jgi:predicted nucleic acid-binding protein
VELCRRSSARGNLVPDAYLAALAIESGCEWVTLDQGFGRFPELRWRAPE